MNASPITEKPARDPLTRGRAVIAIIATAIIAGVGEFLLWFASKQTNLPAFNTSYVTKALSTVGTIAVLVLTAGLLLWWMIGDATKRGRIRGFITHAVAYLAPAGIVFTTIGVPLSASRLYLEGLQVDQGFRTQFLTRMAQGPSLADMNYIDMPTYYPAGWFFGGGRLAQLLGMPGWEVYQPWALISIAATCCVLVPVWQRLTGSLPTAAAIALASTAIVLVMAPEEPYAAISAIGVPAATLLARRAVRGSWFAVAGLVIYLGFSATFYTLFTGLFALSFVAFSLFAAIAQKKVRPVLMMAATGIGSSLIAMLSWGPYLVASLSGEEHSGATAMHYLPYNGAEVSLPFLELSMLGVLCLIGLVHLVVRWKNRDIRTMGIFLGLFYAWTLASMLATLFGQTLLGFRVGVVITLMFATLGILAIGPLLRGGVDRLYPQQITPSVRRVLTVVVVVLASVGSIHFIQDIPYRNQSSIDHAYSDTDGYGARADRFSPDSSRYYADIDAFIKEHHPDPDRTIIATDETRFLSYFPYYGFQAFTSHYANPLGEFDKRNDALSNWAEGSWDDLSDPADFAAALEDTTWEGPNAFIFRGDTEETGSGYKLHIAEDIHPNLPNVRFHGLFFNPEVFDDPALWDIKQVGPFVVVTRNAT